MKSDLRSWMYLRLNQSPLFGTFAGKLLTTETD